MKKILHLFFPALLLFFLIAPAWGETDDLRISASTQFLWGDDLLGDGQAILAQYLRFGYTPKAEYSITGYGRLWKNFAGDGLREDDLFGRVYYLYLDYSPLKPVTVRLGRHYVNFTAGSSILDGASVYLKDLGPVGLTVSGGMDVVYSLDSEHSRLGNYFFGADLHLMQLRPVQAGISYVRKYDEWDNAREEFGVNARGFFKNVSPYAEVRYDNISESIDEATVGVDINATKKLFLELEFYHAYPTFDATSIYSVFAVDRYQEYLVSAEYEISEPMRVFASYAKQLYEDGDDEDADRFRAGARRQISRNLVVNGFVDYRNGFGGDIWGFELTGDYKSGKKLLISAGAQYDIYERPVEFTPSELIPVQEEDTDYATRLWIGAQYMLAENLSIAARLEENINENFDHRPLGYVVLTFNPLISKKGGTYAK
jgi:hypothetical protein